MSGPWFLAALDRVGQRICRFHNSFVHYTELGMIDAATKYRRLRILSQLEEARLVIPCKVDRGFSFLGDEFNALGLVGIAKPTRQKFVERIHRLYEQGASLERIGDCVRL